MNIGSIRSLSSALALAIAAFPAVAADTLAGLGEVLGELRRGGYVIYFRHGPTDQAGASDEAADLAKCETQRNLSAEGREQATQVGKAFKALKIPVDTVLAGPLCRTKDTARLAFGKFAVDNDLNYAIGVDADETKRLALSLRRMLSTPPVKGTNAVVISHTANLREAAGIWPKVEGVAYVFQPLPGGQFKPVAMVMPDEWGKASAPLGKRK